MQTFLRVLNILLAAVLIAISLYWYGRLPERIPIHFNARGAPDGWGGKAMFLVLPLIGLASAALMAFVGRLAVRKPELMNMPGKERILALPQEARRRALVPLVVTMDVMATLILVLFIVIAVATYRSAMGHDTASLITLPLYGIVGVMVVAPIILMIVMSRREETA